MTAGFDFWDYVVFIAYAILILGVGLWVSRDKEGHQKNAEDYFLASKSLPWWAIGTSLIAANISAEQFIGMSGSGFALGIAIASYEWMAALTLIIVGKYFLPIFIEKGLYTIPEFLVKWNQKKISKSDISKNQDKLEDIDHEFNSDAHLRLKEYISAWESANIDQFIELLKEDATFSMPPIPSWYRGHAEIRALIGKTIFRGEANGRWKLYPTQANQQPAFGLYRKDADKQAYVFYGIQVLTYKDNKISDVLTFRHRTLYKYFSLPEQLPFS